MQYFVRLVRSYVSERIREGQRFARVFPQTTLIPCATFKEATELHDLMVDGASSIRLHGVEHTEIDVVVRIHGHSVQRRDHLDVPVSDLEEMIEQFDNILKQTDRGDDAGVKLVRSSLLK